MSVIIDATGTGLAFDACLTLVSNIGSVNTILDQSHGSNLTGSGETELAGLSAELVALTLRDHSALTAEIKEAARQMRRLAKPRKRWFSTLVGSTANTADRSAIEAVDRELTRIAERIAQLGEAAIGRSIALHRLSEKAANVDTNTYITGMNATFIKAAAAKAASAEDLAADAAKRFLTQALPLWRTTRAQGNSQMRQAASAIEATLEAVSASIDQSQAAMSDVGKRGTS